MSRTLSRALRSLDPAALYDALQVKRAGHSRDRDREVLASTLYETLRALSTDDLVSLVGRRGPRYELIAEIIERTLGPASPPVSGALPRRPLYAWLNHWAASSSE